MCDAATHRIADGVRGEVDAVSLRVRDGRQDEHGPAGAVSARSDKTHRRRPDDEAGDGETDPAGPPGPGVPDIAQRPDAHTDVMPDRDRQREHEQPAPHRRDTSPLCPYGWPRPLWVSLSSSGGTLSTPADPSVSGRRA